MRLPILNVTVVVAAALWGCALAHPSGIDSGHGVDGTNGDVADVPPSDVQEIAPDIVQVDRIDIHVDTIDADAADTPPDRPDVLDAFDVLDVPDVVPRDTVEVLECGVAECEGRCVDTSSDPVNCGGCGNSCPSPANGSPACAAGACSILCDSGYHACGSMCASDTDVTMCGASCTACPPPPPNGTAVCNGTACTVSCSTGYTQCAASCVDVTSDIANCGTCGNACPFGVYCISGHCTYDVASQFSASSNPNGYWQYGWEATPGATFHLYTSEVTSMSADVWGTTTSPNPWAQGVAFNSTSGTIHPYSAYTMNPRQLGAWAGPNGEYSVLRWSAPSTGTFMVSVTLTGLSGYGGTPLTTSDYVIMNNGASISTGMINLSGSGNTAMFQQSISVTAGDTIDVLVGQGSDGSNYYDLTGVDFSVAAM